MKRSDITAVLKKVGLRNIRYNNDTVMRINGKMVRGIPAGTVSPIDATSASTRISREKLLSVGRQLGIELGAVIDKQDSDSLVLNIGKHKLRLSIVDYPAYPPSASMDPNYVKLVIQASYD